MSQRDAGWLQLFAGTSQEALNLHIQAFRIARTAHRLGASEAVVVYRRTASGCRPVRG